MTRDVRRDCVGECRLTYHMVGGGWEAVEILEAVTKVLDWTTNREVPGSTVAGVDGLHDELLAMIRGSIGLAGHHPEEMIVDYGDCPRSCYCDVEVSSERLDQEEREETFEWEVEYVRTEVLSREEDGGVVQYFDALGRPHVPAAHQSLEGPLMVNPGISLHERWELRTRHQAKIKWKVAFQVFQRAGECREYPVDGGFPA